VESDISQQRTICRHNTSGILSKILFDENIRYGRKELIKWKIIL